MPRFSRLTGEFVIYTGEGDEQVAWRFERSWHIEQDFTIAHALQQPAKQKRALLSVMLAALKTWEGIFDEQGRPLPYSPEAFFTYIPPLLRSEVFRSWIARMTGQLPEAAPTGAQSGEIQSAFGDRQRELEDMREQPEPVGAWSATKLASFEAPMRASPEEPAGEFDEPRGLDLTGPRPAREPPLTAENEPSTRLPTAMVDDASSRSEQSIERPPDVAKQSDPPAEPQIADTARGHVAVPTTRVSSFAPDSSRTPHVSEVVPTATQSAAREGGQAARSPSLAGDKPSAFLKPPLDGQQPKRPVLPLCQVPSAIGDESELSPVCSSPETEVPGNEVPSVPDATTASAGVVEVLPHLPLDARLRAYEQSAFSPRCSRFDPDFDLGSNLRKVVEEIYNQIRHEEQYEAAF